MPSMHVGWALWCGLALAGLARTWWQRVLAFSYPVGTTLVVLATGNHWSLDAVAGAVVVGAAWWVNGALVGEPGHRARGRQPVGGGDIVARGHHDLPMQRGHSRQPNDPMQPGDAVITPEVAVRAGSRDEPGAFPVESG